MTRIDTVATRRDKILPFAVLFTVHDQKPSNEENVNLFISRIPSEPFKEQSKRYRLAYHNTLPAANGQNESTSS